jgi:hypothetical protein
LSHAGRVVAIAKNSKQKEYSFYAEHGLKMAKIAPDQKSRIIQREMAAEWVNLADMTSSQSSK